MIPYKDINPSRKLPIMTIMLIAVNSCVFLYELLLGAPNVTRFIYNYASIPAELKTFSNITISQGIHPVISIFTAMFLHGGWFHLLGNMLYLWIFGDNVEERMGSMKFLVFYFICGVIATIAQTLANIDSNIPTLGASGAIAGVLGAYLLLFPRARVKVLVPVFFFLRIMIMPAWFVLGFWIFIQILEVQLSSYAAKGGIAYAAHIGGFASGFILVKFFAKKR